MFNRNDEKKSAGEVKDNAVQSWSENEDVYRKPKLRIGESVPDHPPEEVILPNGKKRLQIG